MNSNYLAANSDCRRAVDTRQATRLCRRDLPGSTRSASGMTRIVDFSDLPYLVRRTKEMGITPEPSHRRALVGPFRHAMHQQTGRMT